jgi:hypothetical protein
MTYKLLMVGSTVTDPNRLGILVTSQMIKRLLLQILTTVNGIYAVTSANSSKIDQ